MPAGVNSLSYDRAALGESLANKVPSFNLKRHTVQLGLHERSYQVDVCR